MRRLSALVAVAIALAACGLPLPWGEFKLSGEITVAGPLRNKLPKENSVLFVVAKNLGGMPVAVHRIVNPHFPVAYTLTKDDVLVPGYRPKGPLLLYVEMNTHGNVGAARKGDFAGRHPDTVAARQSRVHIVIDEQL